MAQAMAISAGQLHCWLPRGSQVTNVVLWLQEEGELHLHYALREYGGLDAQAVQVLMAKNHHGTLSGQHFSEVQIFPPGCVCGLIALVRGQLPTCGLAPVVFEIIHPLMCPCHDGQQQKNVRPADAGYQHHEPGCGFPDHPSC